MQNLVLGNYQIFIPPNSLLALKLFEATHNHTLHRGVTEVMTKVRQQYWAPKLRQLVKRIVRSCYWCKCFGASALLYPSPSNLPKDRTEGSIAFQVVNTNFSGFIKGTGTYKTTQKKEKKVYILIFTCSLSRAVYLELLHHH